MPTIEQIKSLASKIRDNWSLCEFMANEGPRASEKEYIIAETIHACVINHAEHGEAFSKRGANLDNCHGNGLADNRTAYGTLLRDGWLVEQTREGVGRVIVPTDKLIKALEVFFTK